MINGYATVRLSQWVIKQAFCNQILNSVGWNRWLKCVAPPTINPIAHKSSRFFPILPKMGYIGIQKMLVKYAVLEVCSCQINVCRFEDLVCRFKFVDSVCRFGL